MAGLKGEEEFHGLDCQALAVEWKSGCIRYLLDGFVVVELQSRTSYHANHRSMFYFLHTL